MARPLDLASAGLWTWAVRAYARPGAQAACLDLQDAHGLSVPYLLWAAWVRSSDAALLARGARLAREWEAQAIGPLRAVRRALKTPRPETPDAEREALREQVKAAELAAEKSLLGALERLAAPGSSALAESVTAAAGAWGGPAIDAQVLAAFVSAVE